MVQYVREVRYVGRGALKSVALGIGIVALGSLLAIWLDRHNVHGSLALADNIATGITAGLIVFLYELWHQRDIEQKLQAVRLMNHHVRNDLQVIIYATSADTSKQVPAKAVQDAVKHIEWALREVLPGELHMPCLTPTVPFVTPTAAPTPLAETRSHNGQDDVLWRCS